MKPSTDAISLSKTSQYPFLNIFNILAVYLDGDASMW